MNCLKRANTRAKSSSYSRENAAVNSIFGSSGPRHPGVAGALLPKKAAPPFVG